MGEWMHPCQKCGACCTAYCVAFDKRELSKDHFGVPIGLTYKLSSDTLAMKNKTPNSERCIALDGHVGKFVGCKIYSNRPSPCRNFKASYEDGTVNPRCDECRIVRGMRPLTLDDWRQDLQKIELI